MDTTKQNVITEFANLLTQSASELFGVRRVHEIVGEGSVKDIFIGKETKSFFGKKTTHKHFPEPFVEPEFSGAVDRITAAFFNAFGQEFTEAKLESIYSQLEKDYSVGLVGQIIMPYIPVRFLEKHRVQYLSKEELESEVLRKTKELQKLNDDLESRVAQRTAEFEKILQDQHKSAKMLVRRDLELTKANEELQELDLRKSEFLSIAAHQLRTPLSGIKWTISMILKGELGAVSQEQKVFLMKSYESNERMINLVDDMLHADRIDSGKYHLNLIPTQLLDLVDNVLYEILPNAQKGQIKIEFNRGTDPLPQVNIDQEKMRAVFQNLLDNAVKYSRPGGLVKISVKHDSENITFTIEDSGIGIPEDQGELLFSRFFRARNALKIETDGTGLGLFIAKSIIERHGGKIWFESVENKGTKFYFNIKL